MGADFTESAGDPFAHHALISLQLEPHRFSLNPTCHSCHTFHSQSITWGQARPSLISSNVLSSTYPGTSSCAIAHLGVC